MNANTSAHIMDNTLATKSCGKSWCKRRIPSSSVLKHCDPCRALNQRAQNAWRTRTKAATAARNVKPVVGEKHARSPQRDSEERPPRRQKTMKESVAGESEEFEPEEVLDSSDNDTFDGHAEKVSQMFLCKEPVLTIS